MRTRRSPTLAPHGSAGAGTGVCKSVGHAAGRAGQSEICFSSELNEESGVAQRSTRHRCRTW